jgi:hypothetical protein
MISCIAGKGICADDKFTCDGHCINKDWVCDGIADCVDHSDELPEHCGKFTVLYFTLKYMENFLPRN